MTAIDQMLEAVSAATLEFCETVLLMDYKVSESTAQETETRTQISLALVGADVAVQLVMIAESETCKSFSRTLFGMEESEDISDQDVTDGMGEVANIIAGSFKSRLNDTYPGLTLGLPTLGTVNAPVLYPSRVSVDYLPVAIGDHSVLLMVMMEEKNGLSARPESRVRALQHVGR